jgi:hypothetical protein
MVATANSNRESVYPDTEGLRELRAFLLPILEHAGAGGINS